MANPVTGSGRRVHWGRFLEDPQLHRSVEAPGDLDINPATIEAITEYINAKERIAYVADEYCDRGWAKDNLLQLQLVIDPTVTSYDVEVFGTLVGAGFTDAAERWAYVFRQTDCVRSQFVTLEQVPPGYLKVVIRNIVGTGSVNVYYSITD